MKRHSTCWENPSPYFSGLLAQMLISWLSRMNPFRSSLDLPDISIQRSLCIWKYRFRSEEVECGKKMLRNLSPNRTRHCPNSSHYSCRLLQLGMCGV
jgi:hypothetical protein